jgi:hypothetical protein
LCRILLSPPTSVEDLSRVLGLERFDSGEDDADLEEEIEEELEEDEDIDENETDMVEDQDMLNSSY